ncbi:uncharacterized protein B0403.1-like [Antedon mediterranea]|uniref:uncharacterized protein B0403.1-like n=1 Tax=Antedon mediterranea TaxID=105859 RepID=UPI003AF65D47
MILLHDAQVLQEDLEKACDWSDKWQLPFNEGKCKVMHFGMKNNKHLYAMRGFLLNEVDHEKDLGVTIDSKLVFNVHVADVAMRANRKLGMVYRAFKFLNMDGFLRLYKAIIRPTLEYCNVVFNSLHCKEEDLLEKVQERATKLIFSIRHLPYSERLKILNLPTLAYRRQRAHLIQIFKILHGVDSISADSFFSVMKMLEHVVILLN